MTAVTRRRISTADLPKHRHHSGHLRDPDPDELPDEVATPANCALATVVAGWEAIELKAFKNVLIQGAGALGFYAAALAHHYGCRRIIVTDILDHRLEAIKAFGVTDTINTRNMKDDEIAQAVRDLTDGFGVDAAMEAAGAPAVIPAGLKSLRIGGATWIMGAPSRAQMSPTTSRTSSSDT